MRDAVLLDESAAWQLFGGYNIVGQVVQISGVPHVVSGVVKNAEGRLAEAGGHKSGMIYLSFESLMQYGDGVDSTSSGEEGSTGGMMQSMEWLLPEPVKGFALQTVREKMGVNADAMQLVDNAKRFSYASLLSIIGSFGTRSMQDTELSFPYWENIARGYEDIFALLFFVQLILLFTAIILLVEMIVNGYRHKSWTAEGVYTSLKDFVYDIQSGMKAHKQKWKYF